MGAAHVDVPADCGSRAEFERELERLLGPVERPDYAVRLAPVEGGAYRLSVTVRGERRELNDTDCRTLFKSAAVVIAVAVNPDLNPSAAADEPSTAEAQPPTNTTPSAPSEPSTSPAPSRSPSKNDTPEARDERTPQSNDATPHRFGIGAGAGLIAGLLPEPAPLIELRALLEPSRFGGLLALRYVAPTTEHLADEREVKIRAFGARLAASYRPFELTRLSVGLESDLMLGRASGVAKPLSDSAWSLATSLDVGLIPLKYSIFELELAGFGRLALLRPRFEIEGFGEAYRVPAFAGGGAIRANAFFF